MSIEEIARESVKLGAKTEIVGAWVWSEFDSKPSVEIRAQLKALGFKWNKKRGVWQWAGVPAVGSKAGSGAIKFKYGCKPVTLQEEGATL